MATLVIWRPWKLELFIRKAREKESRKMVSLVGKEKVKEKMISKEKENLKGSLVSQMVKEKGLVRKVKPRIKLFIVTTVVNRVT